MATLEPVPHPSARTLQQMLNANAVQLMARISRDTSDPAEVRAVLRAAFPTAYGQSINALQRYYTRITAAAAAARAGAPDAPIPRPEGPANANVVDRIRYGVQVTYIIGRDQYTSWHYVASDVPLSQAQIAAQVAAEADEPGYLDYREEHRGVVGSSRIVSVDIREVERGAGR